MTFCPDLVIQACLSFTTLSHWDLSSIPFKFLGRHFGCRPLDPTLDIWSNFVKKEKKKKRKKAFYLLAMSQGFPRVPKGY